MDKVGLPQLISDIVDELLALAESQGCKFAPGFKQKVIDDMTKPQASESIMWQDYIARRPMEVETFLGSPIRIAQETGVKLPRIETLYAVLHNLNITNQARPKGDPVPRPPGSPGTGASPLPRMSTQSNGRPMPNGMPNGMSNGMPNGMPNGPGPRPRPRTSSQMGPPGMRRPPPPPMNGAPPNGYGRPMTNGYAQSRQQSRRGSMEGADLEEFSHLVVYDDIPEGGKANFGDMALRERELQLRQRELALREQELRMRRGPPGPRRGPPPSRGAGGGVVYDDEDDEDDYFDPTAAGGASMVDADNFDMMSVTSRKNRKMPSQSQFRKKPESGGMPPRGGRFRPGFGGRNRSSLVDQSMPSMHTNIMDDPLMSCSSNRYGTVDRGAMHAESRANSLTASRLDELQYGPGGPPPMMNGAFPRRASQSPGDPYSPSVRGMNGNGMNGTNGMYGTNGMNGMNGRPSPPNGMGPPPHMNGRPSPPNGMRQPVPRYPPGHGNAVAPQQVEQHVGVSALKPPKTGNVRSLTGSASASAGSGDSTHLDSEPSAHSSQSSFGPRPPIGVR